MLQIQLTPDYDVTDIEHKPPNTLFKKEDNSVPKRGDNNSSHEEGELSPKSDELLNNGHGNNRANQHFNLHNSDRPRFVLLPPKSYFLLYFFRELFSFEILVYTRLA